MSAILNKFTKWRTVFAFWQLGTRSDTDAECLAVKDHRELSMLLRAEMNAMANLMIQKGVFTAIEYTAQVEVEAEYLDKEYEKQFPGFSTTELGVQMKIPDAIHTMKNWRP